MKRRLAFVLAISVMLAGISFPAGAEEVSLSACAYVLYCVNSGEALLAQRADEPRPIASTTKILTALLTLEAAEKDNAVVTFTEEMIAEGSSMYLEIGEQIRLYDLAVGMLMQSGNDAANAAALTLGGSFEGFARMMNERAERIGMTRSHFVTPSGLDDEAHYATARDMALLLAEAMQNDSFKEITGQTAMTVNFVLPADKTVTYRNHNRLLSTVEGCIGGKTGYTDAAGRCLVSVAERDGLTLIAVTLDDPDDWNDHARLYEWGFGQYYVPAGLIDRRYAVDVVGARENSLELYIEPGHMPAIKRGEEDRLTCSVFIPDFVFAPVREGEQIGSFTCLSDGEPVAQAPLLAAQTLAFDDS